MAFVDIPGGAGTYRGTVEIILRAVRLGLFTAAEARTLIDPVRLDTTASLVSIQDNSRAGLVGRREPSRRSCGGGRAVSGRGHPCGLAALDDHRDAHAVRHLLRP